MSKHMALFFGGAIITMCAVNSFAETPKFDYLSDVVYGISTYQLDYTKIMGADTTAYPLWPQPIPGDLLRIKDKAYTKGLGAPYGDILIMLDGKYDAFESDIGVQPGTTGVAIFKVTVDGKLLYNSGDMTENDKAKHVSVSLKGAHELRLNAASTAKPNWADAKLICSSETAVVEPVDMAPFAKVATWDPARSNGVTVFRLEEFPTADVFTETDVKRIKGRYVVPVAKNGDACIGLQWLERRRLKEFGIQFADKTSMPSVEGVRVEGWMIKDPLVLDGHSEWQGKWTPMKGVIEADGSKWTFRFSGKDNRDISEGTLKIRWIFPSPKHPILIRKFFAHTTSMWDTAEIMLQAETRSGTTRLEIYNGEILEPQAEGSPQILKWDMSKPIKLKVHYTTYRPWGYDRTVIRVKSPSGSFGIAVDDLLKNGQIYIREAGLFASKLPSAMNLAEYKKSIKSKETILERVRKMPDQTFENAVKALYNPLQDRSSTLLSLAFDNHKAIVDKSGSVHVGPLSLDFVELKNPIEINPQFGSGANPGYVRNLENDWMPMPHISITEGNIKYGQTVCVTPYDKSESDPWLNSKPLCAIRYTIENMTAEPATASMKLTFMADTQKKLPAVVRGETGRILSLDDDGKLLAVVDNSGAEMLQSSIVDNTATISGILPANAKAVIYAYLPMEWDLPVSEQMTLTGEESLFDAAKSYWQNLIAPSMKINIPDKQLQNIIFASQAHCMLASRNEENGKYVDPWIASTYYCSLDTESHGIIYGMDLMGQHEYARRSLDFFIKRENPAGYLSHGYTMMGTGQHIWLLTDHYRLTGDTEWWKQVGPKVDHIANWIVKQTDKTKRLDPYGKKLPEYGLIPPGTVADWQDWGYIFAAQGYYYAGLSRAAKTLDETGYPDAGILVKDAKKLKSEIRRAYDWTQARTPVVPLQDGTWVPSEPYQLLKPGPCDQFFPNYNGAWLYDVELGAHHMVDEGVLDPRSQQVDWMANHMEDVQFMRDGLTAGNLPSEATKADWFNKGGFPRAQPYYGRYPELCALRDDVKPFIRTYFNQLAPMFNREDLSLYENPWASVWNKTAETGHFLQQTRMMFLMERSNELWLAPFVTNNWLKDGMTVSIKDASSFFGNVSYTIISHVKEGYIDAVVEAPKRTSPDKLVIRLRHPDSKKMKRVLVNGKSFDGFDSTKEIITIRKANGCINIRAEY